MTKRDAGLLSTALLLGLVLRVLFLRDVSGHVLYQVATGDPAVYLNRAWGILSGVLVPPHAFFHSCPFYPFVLALIERVVGAGLTPVRIVQALVGLGSVALVYQLGRITVGRVAGLIAAFFAAAYGPFLFFEAELLEITIVLAAVEGGLVLLLAAARSGRAWQAAAAGALLGLAGLGKPNILLFAPAAAGWLYVVLRRGWTSTETRTAVARESGAAGRRKPSGRQPFERRRAACVALLVFVAAGVVVLPATVHNWRASGDLIPVSSNGGINLYIGNHPGAQGVFDVPPSMRFDLRVASKAVAERAVGRELSDGEVSDYWAGLAFRFMRSDPGAAVRITARKFVLFWNHFEIPNHYDMNFVADFAPVLAVTPSRFAVVAPLGLLGLALALRARKRVGLLVVFGVVFMGSVLPFFITARYRLAIVPILLVGAGFAVEWFADVVRRRAWRMVGATAAVLIVLAAGVNVRTIEYGAGPMHNTLGAILGSRGDMDGAAEEFAKAVSVTPNDVTARYNLGLALLELGRPANAIEHLTVATDIHPGYHEALLELARARLELGQLDDAEASARRVLTADPPAHPQLAAIAKAALDRIEAARDGTQGR